MTILVACGLQREAAIIARAGLYVIAGGGDAARLERELEASIAPDGISGLLSCGIAGALDPTLRAGDVVIGELDGALHPGEGRGLASQAAVTEDVALKPGSPQLGPGVRRGESLVEWLAPHLADAHRGTIIGGNTIIASAAEKATLYAETGALAVDMESHIAARVAARHGLPFAILRTISDTADHALPPAALVGMKPDGGVALGAVLASLARYPAQLPALIRTGRDAGAAFASLRRALRTLEAVGIGRLDLRQLGLDMR